MALLKFLKGNYSSLSTKAITEGQVLICGDTGEMFVDVAADKRVKIGDFVVISNIKALEALDATVVPTSRLYYVEDGNILARSNGTGWTQINKQKTLAELGGVSSTTYATDKAALVQADTENATAISDLETLVGTLPEGATATTVVGYINEKTAGIASDAALTELAGRVTTAEGKLTTLTGADTVEGSVAKALKDAKAYTDEKDTAMDARMDVVEGSITTLTGEESVAGSVKAIAKSYADGKDVAIAAAKSAADAAQATADTKTTMAEVEAKNYATKTDAKGYADAKDTAIATAQAAADAAQADVDALEAKVGTVPDKKTVIGMIAEAQAAATYDDTEVRGLISDNAEAIEAHKTAIDAKVTTLIGEDADKSVRTIASEETAKIVAGADASFDTLKEIADWISSHKTDAAAMNSAIVALEKIVDGIGGEGEKATVVAYVTDAIAALKIGDYAKAADLTALAARVDVLEATVGKAADGESAATGLVKAVADNASAIAAINNVETGILKTAKDYADSLVADGSAIDGRIDALEAAKHTHNNKTLLDTYTQTEENLADAVAKKHSHDNKTVLDGITAKKVSAWDAAQANAEATAAGALSSAKTELEGKITAAQTAAEGKVTELANGAVAANTAAIEVINGTDTGSIAKALSDAKAYTDALANGQVTTNKNDIASLLEQITWGSF